MFTLKQGGKFPPPYSEAFLSARMSNPRHFERISHKMAATYTERRLLEVTPLHGQGSLRTAFRLISPGCIGGRLDNKNNYTDEIHQTQD